MTDDGVTVHWWGRAIREEHPWEGKTYLENRLSMRPAGVVSKKLIGERKIAKAIRSCNFRLAWESVS
jgi:hypothetical protein